MICSLLIQLTLAGYNVMDRHDKHVIVSAPNNIKLEQMTSSPSSINCN